MGGHDCIAHIYAVRPQIRKVSVMTGVRGVLNYSYTIPTTSLFRCSCCRHGVAPVAAMLLLRHCHCCIMGTCYRLSLVPCACQRSKLHSQAGCSSQYMHGVSSDRCATVVFNTHAHQPHQIHVGACITGGQHTVHSRGGAGVCQGG